jgi:hypothetical protein
MAIKTDAEQINKAKVMMDFEQSRWKEFSIDAKR